MGEGEEGSNLDVEQYLRPWKKWRLSYHTHTHLFASHSNKTNHKHTPASHSLPPSIPASGGAGGEAGGARKSGLRRRPLWGPRSKRAPGSEDCG